MVNSNKDSKNVVPQTEDEKNAEAQESLAKSAKYISDAMQRRQDRFDNPVETSQVDVRKERQRLIDSLTEEKPNLDPDQKPIDNPIPVKHNGEELTPANIGNVLATRDLMQDLRSADPFRQGGGRPFSKTDRSRFLEVLERVVRQAKL